MPFYVSPEQAMKDKSDYARKRIMGIRSGLVIACEAGILFVAPNASRALRKFSEIYDRIAFAAVGRYNEFETLRKAGVRYADMTGFQYDRQDVTARGLANWYAQLLGGIFTDSQKPFEVEIVVAEVGKTEDDDELYRITFDGSVTDEHGFVVMGGQADQVAAALKDSYSDGMTLEEAFTVAITALPGQGNGGKQELKAGELEVALLDRGRPQRAFRRVTGARLEGLMSAALGASKTEAITGTAETETDASTASDSASTASDSASTASDSANTDSASTGDTGTGDAAEAGNDSPQ
jgi:proteasome alpha subunit